MVKNLLGKITENPFDFFISLPIMLSVTAVFAAIFIDFMRYNQRKSNKSKHSSVATGTMFGFFAVYYVMLVLKIGMINITNPIKIIGVSMIVIGAAVNISGRVQLGNNWANHIKIYDNHTLITNGIYSVCRHPLYSSIILMLLGGCVVYGSYTCAFLTVFVFIPMMNYRAKQEEKMLIEKFIEYKEYMEKVRRFI